VGKLSRGPCLVRCMYQPCAMSILLKLQPRESRWA
jgi:hypothetical protein